MQIYPDQNFNDRVINPQAPQWEYTFKVKTPPTAMPVTLEEVKTFGRLESMDEDSLIEMFVKGATEAAEEYMGRAIMQQTIVMKMDFYPGFIALVPAYLATSAMPIPLSRPPLVNITEVRTLYEDNTNIEIWPLTDYYWHTGDDAKFMVRKSSIPPINTERYRGGIEIEYIAGYGNTGATIIEQRAAVPMPIKLGIMLWANIMYSQRTVATTEPPQEVKAALDTYKILRV
jgi:uncharacterized phiE125 gp8 family phage protein